MSTQIKLRGDTAANWTSVDPILADREPGVEVDTHKFKIGDGTTAWTSLPYVQPEDQTLPTASTTVSGIVELATNGEATTGTDTARAVTPAGVKAVVDALVAGQIATDEAAIAGKLTKASNLSDLPSVSTARTNLGLGTAATVNTGTSSGDIPLLSTGGVLPIARVATGTPDGTKFVRDDGTLAAPVASGGGLTRLSSIRPATIGSTNAVVNSTTETEIYNHTLTASALADGDTLINEAALDAFNNSGGACTYTYRLYIGSTLILATGAISAATSSVGRFQVALTARLSLVNRANDLRVRGVLIHPTGGGNTAWKQGNSYVGVQQTTSAADLTADNTLRLTVQLSVANALSDLRLYSSTLDRVR